MSSHQLIDFLAVDGPVLGKHIPFMEDQSSRADITARRFTNEYNYGDFHGDALGMMRRGYDLHFHFASYGIRTLMFRLPGTPCHKKLLEQFVLGNQLEWSKDQRGNAGVLTFSPMGEQWNYLQDPSSVLDQMVSVRKKLLIGDMRPLFLAWLACCECNDSETPPPIPAGFEKLDASLESLLDLWEIPGDVLQRAAKSSPPLPKLSDEKRVLQRWLKTHKKDELLKIAERLLGDESEVYKSKLLAKIRKGDGAINWPVGTCELTTEELFGWGAE